MTKHVFNGAMTAHVWAQLSQDNGRSSHGNISFSGPRLFSYAALIAVILPEKDVTLFAERYEHYSVTTSKHMNYARQAARTTHKITVPFIGDHYTPISANQHGANLLWLVTQFTEHTAKCKRMRDYGDYEVNQLQRLAQKAQLYAELFDLPPPAFDVAATQQEIIEHHAKLAAKRADPKYAAKREKERARRAELELTKNVRAIERWRSGEDNYLQWDAGGRRNNWRNRQSAPTLMRLSRDGTEIETSLGARFPTEHGKRAFRLIQQCRAAAQSWQRNGHTIHLGNFALDRIEPNGNVKAGCHTVAWEEIERMAGLLGLLNTEESKTA
jgi:hypothetical protein